MERYNAQANRYELSCKKFDLVEDRRIRPLDSGNGRPGRFVDAKAKGHKTVTDNRVNNHSKALGIQSHPSCTSSSAGAYEVQNWR